MAAHVPQTPFWHSTTGLALTVFAAVAGVFLLAEHGGHGGHGHGGKGSDRDG